MKRLQTAILDEIAYLTDAGISFTKHDITRSLRIKANDNQLELSDVEMVSPSNGDPDYYDIRHADVSSIFDEMWESLSKLIVVYTKVYNKNWGCFVYEKSDPFYRFLEEEGEDAILGEEEGEDAILGEEEGEDEEDGNLNPTPVKVGVTRVAKSNPLSLFNPPQVQKQNNKIDASEFARRAGIYLSNCSKLGVNPTIKRVQSAVKRDRSSGWAESEIKGWLTSNGYILNNDQVMVSNY